MAKKRRNRSPQRDVIPIATPVLRVKKSNYAMLSDRRPFHPERPYHLPFSRPREMKVVHDDNVNVRRNVLQGRSRSVPMFRFAVPRVVGICVRRKVRRSVLFALRRTGRGARARKRRNVYSGVSCK